MAFLATWTLHLPELMTYLSEKMEHIFNDVII